jgi:hypothetical protein
MLTFIFADKLRRLPCSGKRIPCLNQNNSLLPFPGNLNASEPLAKLQWCDEFSTGMSGKRGVRGVLG